MSKEKGITVQLGKVVLGLIMMIISVLVLFGIYADIKTMAVLLFFGGIGTIMWGIDGWK